MNAKLDELICRVRELEAELAAEYRKKAENFEFVVHEKRARFAEEVARQERRLKSGLPGYVASAGPLTFLAAPVIYAGFVPFLLLDLFLLAYQAICFPLFGITRVIRGEYLAWDREDLPYLNALERF